MQSSIDGRDVGLDSAKQLGFDRPSARSVDEGVAQPTESVPFFSKDGSGSDIVETRARLSIVKKLHG